MKKKILLLGCALVLAVGVAATVLHNVPAARPEPESTPISRKIGSPGTVMIKVMQGMGYVNQSCGLPLGLTWAEAPERTCKEGVSLSFTGLAVDEAEGTVTVNLLMENEQEEQGDYPFYLDYYSDGKWYTIYSFEQERILSGAVIPPMVRVFEPGSTEITMTFPKEAFKNPGEYRVAKSHAYCTFELTLNL